MTKAVVTSSVQEIQERNFFRGELVDRFIRFAVERMRNTAEQTAADSIFSEVIGNAKD